MARFYSRLATVEERKNIKKAASLVLISIVILVLLFFYGIPLFGRFATFVSDIGKSGSAITNNDKTPPAPPRFSTFSDFTNKDKFDITGNSESGATIKVILNDTNTETLADKDGHFSVTLSLNSGENAFYATATDTAGNISQETERFKIIYDNTAPELTVESPANGAQFIGTKQRQITIQGTTDPEAEIRINDRVVSVDDNGKFQFTTTLTEGENKFLIKAIDKASNTTEQELILSFII